MKYFILIQFPDGTNRFLTYAANNEWEADCDKPAYNFGSYDCAKHYRVSFGLMGLNPNIVVIEDNEEVPVNQSLDEEKFDRVIRLNKLREELTKGGNKNDRN